MARKPAGKKLRGLQRIRFPQTEKKRVLYDNMNQQKVALGEDLVILAFREL